MSKKDEYFTMMEAQIKKWDAEVDKLRARSHEVGAEARAKSLTLGALITFSALAASLSLNVAQAAAVKDYGKQGEPIELVVGYQPYYTESWSGVIMRDKKFYEKYLPKGSNVSFQVAVDGAAEFVG